MHGKLPQNIISHTLLPRVPKTSYNPYAQTHHLLVWCMQSQTASCALQLRNARIKHFGKKKGGRRIFACRRIGEKQTCKICETFNFALVATVATNKYTWCYDATCYLVASLSIYVDVYTLSLHHAFIYSSCTAQISAISFLYHDLFLRKSEFCSFAPRNLLIRYAPWKI